MLEIGTKIKNFTLPNELGEEVSLDSFLGKRVVIYFYPKDSTPGCTTQACAFRDTYLEFKNLNTVVIGISKDPVKSHKKFKDEQQLPFILLSDENLEVIKYFDVWKEKKMFGKPYMGIIRSTFVLNEKHELIKDYLKADPANNANEILDFLKS